MAVMMLVVLVALVAVGIALAASTVTRDRLPSPATPELTHLLREQAERIDQLEQELHRLQEQADFTERLLTERGGVKPGELPPPESSET